MSESAMRRIRNEYSVALLLKRLRSLSEEDRATALAANRYQFWRALDDLWNDVKQLETLEPLQGDPVELPTISWPRVLEIAVRRAPGYASLLNNLWQRQPCTLEQCARIRYYTIIILLTSLRPTRAQLT